MTDLLARLVEAGSIGLDLSPGDPLCSEAAFEIGRLRVEVEDCRACDCVPTTFLRDAQAKIAQLEAENARLNRFADFLCRQNWTSRGRAIAEEAFDNAVAMDAAAGFAQKAIGGSDVCHTCEAHCVVIEDLEKDLAAERAGAGSRKQLTDLQARIAKLESKLTVSEGFRATNRANVEDLAKQINAKDERISSLEAALRKLIQGYVNTLESGAIAIQAYGGRCDSVAVMEVGDPHLRAARAVLTQSETPAHCEHGATNPPHNCSICSGKEAK